MNPICFDIASFDKCTWPSKHDYRKIAENFILIKLLLIFLQWKPKSLNDIRVSLQMTSSSDLTKRGFAKEDERWRGYSHQTLKKAVRGKNLDVYEGYFGVVYGYEGYMRGKREGCLATRSNWSLEGFANFTNKI